MCTTKLLFHEIKMWKIFSTSMNLIVGRNQAGNVADSKGLSWFQVEGYWWAYTRVRARKHHVLQARTD